MKVTKSYIKKLIKEELSNVLNEEKSSQLDNLLKSWAQKKAKQMMLLLSVPVRMM